MYDVIDEFVNNYNHTINRGIGYEPIKVNSFIENNIVQDKKQQTIKIQSNNTNDLIDKNIRILNDKSLFEDIMIPRYSNTLFTVLTKETKNNVLATDNKYEYKVKKSNIKIVDGIKIFNNDISIIIKLFILKYIYCFQNIHLLNHNFLS